MSLPIPEKKKKVPSFNEVMGDTQKVPSYEEVMGEDSKKKVGGEQSIPTSVPSGSDALSTGNEIPTVSLEDDNTKDAFQLAQEHNDLSNKKIVPSEQEMGASQGMATPRPDEEAQKQAERLRDFTINNRGVDPVDLYSETKGLDNNDYAKKGFSKEELLNDRENNNELYQRKLGRLKWQKGLDAELTKSVTNGDITLDEFDNINHAIASSLENSNTGDYNQQRDNINTVATAIKKFGGEKSDELLKNYATEVGKVYGNSYKNNFDKTVTEAPESKYFNPDQLLGYQYIKDVDPEKAQQYERAMVDPKLQKDLSQDEKTGLHYLQQTLEEAGIDLQQNSVTEELSNLNNIAKKNGGLTPDELIKATELESKQDELTQKQNALSKKYPEIFLNKVDDATQEILGQDLSFGKYASLKAGQAVNNTFEGVWEAVSSPFMSDASNKLRELSIMGDDIGNRAAIHETNANKNLVTDKLIIHPELQSQLDDITKDKSLTQDQKHSKVFSLFYNNPDKFGWVPVQNGQFNISPSSILYGITDIGTALLPFVGLEAATGGGATAGAARKFLSTFTSAAATSFHDNYAAAIKEGVSQSDAYKKAMGMTAIDAFAMAGAGTAEKIRAMAGNKTSASKVISQMSDEAIQKEIDKGAPKAFQGLRDRIKATPKMIAKGAKTGFEFETAMTGAKEAQHQIYNTPIDREQNFKQSLLGIANFGIAGAGLGHIGFKAPTELQKSGLVEFGSKPDEYLQKAEEMKNNGQLSQSEYDHRKDLIEKSQAAYKVLPKANDKGKPLTETQKGEYLYNTVIKNEGNKAASSLPPKQAEKAEHTAAVADHANDLILDPKTDKQLQDRKGVLERKLEPKKDAEGNAIELPEAEIKDHKAELEAINNQIEFNDRYEKLKATPQNEGAEENIAKENEVPNTEMQTGDTNEPVNKVIEAAEGEPPPPPVAEVVGGSGENKTNGISKKALKQDYDFTKEFASVTDQEVANKAMDRLHETAGKNGVSPEQQAANEVANMKNKKGEASEHDIMVAAFHLRTLDELIKKANDKGEDASHLLSQREEALSTLRQLGNNAGRNLRLFGNVYKKVEGGRLEVVRAELSKTLGISEIPKTMLDLKLSKLSPEDKMKVQPYVKAIEELNKTIADINSKIDKGTTDINSKEVQDYIAAEIAKRSKESKSNTPKAREKKSKQLKDIAQKIRTQNELDKFQKGADGEITKSSMFGDVDFKELAAQALEYLSKAVEKGEDLGEAIKKAAIKFKGKFDAGEFGKALSTIVSRATLPDKNEVIGKIKEVAKNSGATSITPDMVKHGLINDVVNDYIHSDAKPENIIKLATKELKIHLPDISESQVEDAITKRGEFKQKTKSEINKDIADKKATVKKLASQKNIERELGNGVRKEPAANGEIKIAKDAENFINEIKNDNTLSEETKKEHIKAVEKQRDQQLKNTRQGVLSNLKDAIDNHVSDLVTKQNDAIVAGDTKTVDAINEVKRDLTDLSDRLSPNDENLKDQIDKADQDLHAIIKANEGTDFANDLKSIQKDYHDNWQKAADEIQHQALIKKAEQSLKESERRLAAGQYTEIPTTPYDVARDKLLAQKEAESKKAWATLNSLANRAKEQRERKGAIGKWLSARRQWLIMSPGAMEKVLGSGITKPLIDPLIKQTAGRLSGLVTGIKPTKFEKIFSTYRQMWNQSSASNFMSKMNDAYVDEINNHAKTVRDFGADSPEAKKSLAQLQDAELNHQAGLGYLFINANSAIDIAQVMAKGATDLDAKVGKYAQSKYAERTKAQEVAFWVEAVNRTHSAIKSVSYRQSLLDHYTENLQYFQNKEGKITNDARQKAWDMAVLAGEEGRFGEATALSKWVGRLKSSQNAAVRNTANYALPVAKISINITKQGIDMALPFVEAGWKTLKSGAVSGIKLNSAEGKEYSNFMAKYGDGVKRGFSELPLEQKKYINTLISRGLFGVAQYATVGYFLASGSIKYGGAYDPNDPFGKHKVKGTDGQPLRHGEWEFFGHKAPELLNMVINHSPYSLPASLAAVSHEQYVAEDKKGDYISRQIGKVVNEVYERLPFVTAIDAGRALMGDSYKLENLVANELPTMKATAEHFDKDADGNTRAVEVKGKGIVSTIGNIWKSKVPYLRNTLPNKQPSMGADLVNYKAGGRQITLDEFKDYDSKREKLTEENIKKLKEKGDVVMRDGHALLIPYNKLTESEKKDAEERLKEKATETTKKELFGDKTASQKLKDSQDKEKIKTKRKKFQL